MRNILNILAAAAVAAMIFAVPSCKSEEGDSTYMLVPLRENEKPAVNEETGVAEESVYETPGQVVAHIFMDVEGTNWKPLSYDDALEGILSDTVGGVTETLRADATFTQDAGGSLNIGTLQGGRKHWLVICEGENTIYAWRSLATAGDAGTIYMSVYFRPWKERTRPSGTYTETGWTIANKIKEDDPDDPDDNGDDGGGDDTGGEGGEPENPEEPE